MSSDALNICRRRLNEALGEKSTKYFNHMKQWFRMKLTKEEFDTEARALLHSDQVRYHNEFLLALLNKVEGLAEASMNIAHEKSSSHNRSRRHKRSSRMSEKSNFEPADLLEYLPPNSPPGAGSDGVKYAAQEIFLPDHALVVGRFMLSAWELGLEGADDDAADLIVVAVQKFLKNIISAVIAQRKGYKLRNNRFMYDLGGDMPNMWLRNSNKLYDPQSEGRVGLDDSGEALGPRCPPTLDEVEHSAAFEIACSNEEYADILYCYGFCDGDAAAAREEYQRRFPRRNNVPSAGVFSAAYQRVRESGAVHQRRHDAGRPPRYVAEDEEEILEHFARDPTTSTRIVARQLGLTQWKVWFTVHSARLYPFHYTPVQALHEGDPARKLDFCRFLLHSDENDSNFLKKILWTNESKFDRDGITNYHNMHFWDPQGENPHLAKEGAHQTRFSLNVWMGILHNHVIGPFFLPNNLNGESYENFLRNNLDELLEDVPIGTRRGMIYQHDGCPAHYRVTVRQWLDQKFPQRWIGRGGPIPWPARSPDLTPCDYYLWGHMKSLVYTTPISDVHELRGRVIHAANEIRETLTSRVTRSNLRLRLRRCIRNQGRQFEQDLP